MTSLTSTPSGAGVLPIANIASGTPTGSKFVRDDGTLQTPAAAAVAGMTIQYQIGKIATVVTCSTAMVDDDTPPTSSEGNEVTSVTITPGSASNILVIKTGASFGAAGTVDSIWSICQDATVNSLSAGYGSNSETNDRNQVIGWHQMVAGTTSATTFKFRLGGIGTTLYVNGDGAGNRKLGGVQFAFIEVWEIKA